MGVTALVIALILGLALPRHRRTVATVAGLVVLMTAATAFAHEGDEHGPDLSASSGNAPPGTPHLHFAIFKMTDEKRWWQGTPIDPFHVLR